ncbi:cyclin-I [Synchiropus splendidus]|uniref:cyclin-I n=1 Tax=Synchiropus splendidus TaxID=270530 RepID=UPI00237EB69A|nr:cyclin-I [Synchiropus splendidus]
MKWAEPWGPQRLSFLLEKAASMEANMWKAYVPKKPSTLDTDISPAQRDEAVRWLTELHGRLLLYPETLVLAVSILDRFLASIKARPKYLRCIAIACFFLAAKTCEEDECVPSLKELADSSSCGCSPSEILRMERIILDKLNWDLHTATPLEFLQIYHAMVLSCPCEYLDSVLGMNRSQHLALLTRQLYLCMADNTLMQLRGSMLALALITLDLESCCPDWLALTIKLLKKSQIDTAELIHSRELVACSLSMPRSSLPPNAVYIYQHSQSPGLLPRQVQEASSLGTRSEATTAQQQTPAGAEGHQNSSTTEISLPALLSPPKHHRHPNYLQKVSLRCKASTKRKVEEMEVDDFFDCIKRLYNEDISVTYNITVREGAEALVGAIAGGEGEAAVCSVQSQPGGASSPCPPLQPASAS